MYMRKGPKRCSKNEKNGIVKHNREQERVGEQESVSRHHVHYHDQKNPEEKVRKRRRAKTECKTSKRPDAICQTWKQRVKAYIKRVIDRRVTREKRNHTPSTTSRGSGREKEAKGCLVRILRERFVQSSLVQRPELEALLEQFLVHRELELASQVLACDEGLDDPCNHPLFMYVNQWF
jgi:hypothetical protein